MGFQMKTTECKNVFFTSWDVGGNDKIRPLWRHYYQNIQGIIFVVDCIDRDRAEEAGHELNRVLNESTELRDVPLLILANKQDHLGVPMMGAEEVIDKLELRKLNDQRKWHVQESSAKMGMGLSDGLDWL